MVAAGADTAAKYRPGGQAASGVRLLPPNDPLLRLVDRQLLAADADHRKELFRAVGGPGALLVDGAVTGTWRAKTTGSRLAVSVRYGGH